MRRLLLSAGLLALLAGCGQTSAPMGSGAAPTIPVDKAAAAEDLIRCGGEGFVRYVGVPVVRPGDPIPAEGAYVSWEDLPVKTRILGPGIMATMDYVPDRLNVAVDRDGRIRRLYCG